MVLKLLREHATNDAQTYFIASETWQRRALSGAEPGATLERAGQPIKGGFSDRAKKELGSNAEVEQRGFTDHRIRILEDFERHVAYIHLNSAQKHLREQPEEYRYSSAFPGWMQDPVPQGLKPKSWW